MRRAFGLRLLTALVLAVLVAAGCGGNSQQLLATLPMRVANVEFGGGTVLDGDDMLLHPVDRVLTAIGKGRSDATIVSRDATGVDGHQIGAFSVAWIDADMVLAGAVEHWYDVPDDVTVARSQSSIGAHEVVWTLELNGGERYTLLYRSGGIVYWATSGSRSLAEQFVAAMP